MASSNPDDNVAGLVHAQISLWNSADFAVRSAEVRKVLFAVSFWLLDKDPKKQRCGKSELEVSAPFLTTERAQEGSTNCCSQE
jgi:hypothetical protein